jgi:hypothetical protein
MGAFSDWIFPTVEPLSAEDRDAANAREQAQLQRVVSSTAPTSLRTPTTSFLRMRMNGSKASRAGSGGCWG